MTNRPKLLPCRCGAAARFSAEWQDADGNPAAECSSCNLLSWTPEDWNRAMQAADRSQALPQSVESLIAALRIIEGVRLAIGGTQEIADDYRERCATFLHLNYAALVQALSNQPSEVNEDAERFRWFVAAMIEQDGSKRAALKAQRFPHDLDGYRRSIDAARAAQPEGLTDG